MKFQSKNKHIHCRKRIWKCRLQNGGHFVSASQCYIVEPRYDARMGFLIYIVLLSILQNSGPVYWGVAVGWNDPRDRRDRSTVGAKRTGLPRAMWDVNRYVLRHWLEVRTRDTTVFNSLAPGKYEWNFRYVILKWILMIDVWGIFFQISLILVSLDTRWWSVNIVQ